MNIDKLIENLQSKIKEIKLQREVLENKLNLLSEEWSQEKGELLQTISHKENLINEYEEYFNDYNFYQEMIQTHITQEEVKEIHNSLDILEKKLDSFLIKLMFTEEEQGDCYLELQSGTGGADAEDLTVILYRMYNKWVNHTDRQLIVIDSWPTENGMRSMILHIKGPNSYGLLRRETGIHRIVRYSPFNSLNKRQTSFISVYVYPVVKETVLTIEERDLMFEFSRSSGAGGQHVNKTESAVKVIHIPTGITVRCENERSQMMNKQMAVKLLKIKLLMREKRLKQEKENAIEKVEISWGQQIRSYVLNPYQLVKDLRSGYETSNIEGFFDGKTLNDCLYYNLTKI